jgi:hypothetical protein
MRCVWRASIAGVLLASPPSAARAEACANHPACESAVGEDAVSLRDGGAVCGTIVYRDEGRSLIIVSAHQNRAIQWAEIACIASSADAAPPPAAAAPQPQPPLAAPVDVPVVEPELASPRQLALEWDVRVTGLALSKHYTQRDQAAWSWGMGAGLGFGAALYYAMHSPSGAIEGYGFELGISGTVAYASWAELNAGSATLIEQDLSLRLGARLALSPGVVIGAVWLPTYVDFYGRHVSSRGTINPAGMRFSLDLGSLENVFGLRIALAFLPYVGRLPSMLGLSVGMVFQ